jgi:hypothetical protein
VGLLAELSSPRAAGWTAAEREGRLAERGRDLMCQMLQDQLDRDAAGEQRLEEAPVGADGRARTRMERGHLRAPATTLGEVTVRSWARTEMIRSREENCTPSTSGRACEVRNCD